MTFKDKVKNLCIENGWNFQNFDTYFQMIEETNKVLNLTGFEGDKLWQEGIYESLVFMLEVTETIKPNNILDIGAGAGFPSIPYALTNPKQKITIYEPLKKRVDFLNQVITKLNLNNSVEVFPFRSEDIKKKNIFDLVTARAVGDVATMLMSSFHLVSLKGSMVLIKGKNYKEEIKKAEEIFSLISCELKTSKLETGSDKDNNIIWIKKTRSTNSQFPFKWKEIILYKNKKVL
ncbi:16S rRNA (guanine(527)-N(7))-methyltransferase RsmG [Mycoplasma crocodyli]|uniref:Ribosomal RNA small subunit methyltransferase G n=1 Tax=Mycoplasma crocodyli (strain ATCC 51981 / MP145) TaxID=512564 RepID=D5E4K3_MYCCM|nr:16S rRNA (guanine(527)-N(7))-methyltransferase RsmG [Mycoplasma crocodyli]ADE19933.1 S-adenosyl-L-methionine dependent methyltransferase [Mycoplasma crocodyli MP145]